jgi:hypothetical protein
MAAEEQEPNIGKDSKNFPFFSKKIVVLHRIV